MKREKQACQNCGRLIAANGMKAHLRKHARESIHPVEKKTGYGSRELNSYRIGFADGFKIGKIA